MSNSKNEKISKSMEGNTNAEKWTLEQAQELFDKCINIAKDKTRNDNDFIGEVAQAADTTINILDYLREKYPTLQSVYSTIKRHCEANCFTNGKRGEIVPSLAIMNLKSNHGWTDRNDNTSGGEPIKGTVINLGSGEPPKEE